jgi:DNA polymerase-3 subunit delta
MSKMIIVIHGKDIYRAKENLNKIIEAYKEKNKSGINLQFLDGKDLSFDELKNNVFELSFFQEKKLIIIENIFLNKDFKEEFKERGEEFFATENIVIFYEKDEVMKRDTLLNFLSKKIDINKFDLLSEGKTKLWISKKVKEKGFEIDDNAIELLFKYVQNDLARLEQEINKLVNYNGNISEKDVKDLVYPNTEINIFSIVDAIGARDKTKAIKLANKYLENESVFGLLGLIANQFKNIMIVKNNYGNTKLNPFFARKAYEQSKNFTEEEITKIYEKVLEIDSAIKTGKIEQEIAFETFILEI